MKNTITLGALALIATMNVGCMQTAMVAGGIYGGYELYKQKKDVAMLKAQVASNSQDIERLGYVWQVHNEIINRPAYMNEGKTVTQPTPSWRSQIDSYIPRTPGAVIGIREGGE